jgi:hypothetical protein
VLNAIAERDLAGINVETTHFRWIFPCRGASSYNILTAIIWDASASLLLLSVALSRLDLTDIDITDPDIELVRYGGLVNYGSDGDVLSVRAISSHRTPHMMLFGEPESLRPEDAER